MAVYSIKELEKLSGIKAHTIRIWEKRYSLIEPRRTTTNIRYYTDNDLKKILNVAMLNRNGIKISRIAILSDLELKEEVIRFSSQVASQSSIVDSLVLAMIDLDDYKLESLIDKSIRQFGLKATVVEVLYPFLEKVGILWQSGELYPAQEHFVSNMIRQKIISANNALPSQVRPNRLRFVLLLPEGEYHEIGLLFAQYLIREAGHHVIYLGQSVPYSDLLALGAVKDFDVLLLSSSDALPREDRTQWLKDLGTAFPTKRILYFSSCRDTVDRDLSSNLVFLDKVQDLLDFLREAE